jgi:hypothetical protein
MKRLSLFSDKIVAEPKVLLTKGELIPIQHYCKDILSTFTDGSRNIMALSSLANVPTRPLMAA